MDTRISEVIVTLDDPSDKALDETVTALKKAGLEVTNVDAEHEVIEGTIESTRVKDLEKVKYVCYLRTVFTYDAEFPPGDPRDRNGM
ncbi:MAG TPA: hypothetical protein VHD56_12850 [Tepidisphaeraceae bacterium]|nr:hypothetical protein [Tepidisphaeraceae bacterium]